MSLNADKAHEALSDWGNFDTFGQVMHSLNFDFARDCLILEQGSKTKPTVWGMREKGPHFKAGFLGTVYTVTVKKFTNNYAEIDAVDGKGHPIMQGKSQINGISFWTSSTFSRIK